MVVGFSAASLGTQWTLLITKLIEILSSHDKALMKMKGALRFRVISKPVGKADKKLAKKFSPLVLSREFKEADCVNAFFDLVAPHCNWIHYYLIEFVVMASECEAATVKLQEFIESRKQAAPFIILKPQPEQSTGDLQEPQAERRATMKRKGDVLTLKDYDDQVLSHLCRTAGFQPCDIALESIGTGSIAIRWRILSDVTKDIQHRIVTDTLLQELAEQGVMQINVGPYFHLTVATMEYWKEKESVEVSDGFLSIS